MFLSSSLHTLYTLFLLLTALKWSLYLFFPFILQMWTHHRCSVFVFTAWLSFPEGGLSHLLSSDYLLSQNSLSDVNTQAHRHEFIGLTSIFPPSGVIVHGCVRFLGPQTQTDMGWGGGGGLRGDGRTDWQKRGDPGEKRRAGAGCYNNCRFMVQWLFLQSTQLLSV